MQNDMDKVRDETMITGYRPAFFQKVCTMCGAPFVTSRTNKNICSWECKQEHKRQHARYYFRMKRNFGKGVKAPCQVCGFDETSDQHREGGKVYTLCPNHHALITRNIKTLAQVLASAA